MKKIILALAIVFAAASVANAQYYVGGSAALGFNSSSAVIGINPDLGYKLNEKMSVGACLSLGNAGLVLGSTESFLGDAFAFGVQPYIRYSFFELGPVHVIADGYATLAAGGYHYYDMGDNLHTGTRFLYGLGAKAGLSFDLTDNWTIVSYFGDASLSGTSDRGLLLNVSARNLLSSVTVYYNF